MKPFPWKCPECSQKSINPVCLAKYETTMRHDGRDYRITVKKLDVFQCENCDLIQLPESADEILQDALRKKAGLMSPETIRSTREQLQLSQKQLANELQVAESTLSRWESGMQIQQRAMDRYLRIVFMLKIRGEFDQLKSGSKKFNFPNLPKKKHVSLSKNGVQIIDIKSGSA